MIQLNELKNYLGLKLMIQCKRHFVEYGKKHVLPLNGLNLQIDDTDQMEILMPDGDLKFIEIGTKDFKPLVHPLSMLTEEIEHPVTGDKFVPVLELVKLITQSGFNVDNVSQVYFDEIQKVVTVVFESFKHLNSDLVVTRMFEIDTDEVSFSILTVDSENNVNYYLTGNIFEMYQKLFEWHFDVFDWIGKGLAIDKKETK